MADDTLCACGQPLHYSTPDKRALVERLITEAGGDPLVTIYIGYPARQFRVQRHYIALHGVKAQDLLHGDVPGAVEITS